MRISDRSITDFDRATIKSSSPDIFDRRPTVSTVIVSPNISHEAKVSGKQTGN